MDWYTYILISKKTGSFYKGLTGNLDKRLKDHDRGLVRSTKYILPLELVHVELTRTRAEARKMELFFKSGYGREIISELVK